MNSNASYSKSTMRYIGLDCGDSRRPKGRPLSDEEYAAYEARVEALGFIRKNDAILS